MRSVTMWALLLMPTAGYAATGTVPTAPVLSAADAVCRPTFKVDSTSYDAGTAFRVAGPRPFVLTAQHLFGPDGGLAAVVPWQDMPARARMVRCTPIAGGQPLSGASALAVPGAHAMGSDDANGALDDVAIFRAPPADGTARGLALAVAPPKEGDPVWLIAAVQGSASSVHPAHVLTTERGALLFAYEDPKLDLDATSGAPVVDADGHVVGLNLGGGYDSDAGTVIGVADDLQVLVKAVASADQR